MHSIEEIGHLGGPILPRHHRYYPAFLDVQAVDHSGLLAGPLWASVEPHG